MIAKWVSFAVLVVSVAVALSAAVGRLDKTMDMIDRGTGKIVNIASAAGRRGSPGFAHYSTSKASAETWSPPGCASPRSRQTGAWRG